MEQTTERLPPPSFLLRFSRNVGARLFGFLFVALTFVLAIVGYLNVRLHRHHLEAATLASAERLSGVIKRSTSYHMLHNDREALHQIVTTIGGEPGVVSVRIYNQSGLISFSTNVHETAKSVSKQSEACHGCHTTLEPVSRLSRSERFRIYESAGRRVLGIIDPIDNSPDCANAGCHAHPPQQRILGVIDTSISLERADADLTSGTWALLTYSGIGVLAIFIMSGFLVWRVVHCPVKQLRQATERLAGGELGLQIAVTSNDQLGDLAQAFNEMSRQLHEARQEGDNWAHTLEKRVDEKTVELKSAHQQMLQAEKLSSLGKMAAVVAHEINNPLSGILTYAKLMRKWIERGDSLEARSGEMRDSLQLIESESRRCGNIVQNLLTLARATPFNLLKVDINQVVHQTVRLLEHKFELSNISLDLDLAEELPNLHGDAAQLEQLLLALVMNAIEAMPREGTLRVATAYADGEIRVSIADDGIGIPMDVLAQLFEPFVTTKESGSGVGLGLAISKGIVERHGGRIEVSSEPGRGSTFTIILPADANSKNATSSGAIFGPLDISGGERA